MRVVVCVADLARRVSDLKLLETPQRSSFGETNYCGGVKLPRTHRHKPLERGFDQTPVGNSIGDCLARPEG